MCKTNENARKIAAAARTYLTESVKEHALLRRPSPTEKTIFDNPLAIQFASALVAYEAAGILTVTECGSWWSNWENAVKRRTIETVTCDDCGATVPHDLVTVLGDGDLCLCEGCRKATCGPAPTNEQVERGSDGCGDFEDAPRFQRGTPVELD